MLINVVSVLEWIKRILREFYPIFSVLSHLSNEKSKIPPNIHCIFRFCLVELCLSERCAYQNCDIIKEKCACATSCLQNLAKDVIAHRASNELWSWAGETT